MNAKMLLTTASISIAMGAMAQEDRDYVAKIVGKPYLLIQRVEQIDNLDQGDIFGRNRADFYAVVTVNGVQTETKVLSRDDAWPYWEIPLDYSTRYSRIHVRIMDADEGLERSDDHADINPLGGAKDLSFVYDRHTGLLSGDLYGRTNQILARMGGGDDDVCRILLGVMKVPL